MDILDLGLMQELKTDNGKTHVGLARTTEPEFLMFAIPPTYAPSEL